MKLLNKTSPGKANSTEENHSLMIKMVTSYSIFLLVILIMAVFLYTASVESIRSKQESQSRSLLTSSIQLFDKDLDIMEVFCRQLLQDNTFTRLASSPNEASSSFRLRGYSVKNLLSSNVYPDYLLPINEYYIYMKNSKYIVSPNYFSKMNLYYSVRSAYDKELYEDWLEMHENAEYYGYFVSLDHFLHTSSRNTYLYLLDMSDMSYRNIPAVAGFVINKEKLATRFAGIGYGKNGCVIAVDQDNVQQFCLYDFSEEAAPAYDVEALALLNYSNSIGQYGNGSQRYTVTTAVSESSGWRFYLLQPQSDLTLGTQKYRAFFIISIVLAFLLGGSMILFFSRRNVTPILRLGRELHDAREVQNQLQEVVDKQKPIIRSSYVRQLLLGTISSEDEVSYMKEYLDIPKSRLIYNVLYFVVYNNSGDVQDGQTANYTVIEE